MAVSLLKPTAAVAGSPNGEHATKIDRRQHRGYLSSAFFHEVAFGIATSRFDGQQFTFFFVQVTAVLLSARLEQFARRNGSAGRAMIHSLTVLWFAGTSVLFSYGVGRIFPFVYAHRPA